MFTDLDDFWLFYLQWGSEYETSYVITLQPDLETVERESMVLYLKRVDICANPTVLVVFVLLLPPFDINFKKQANVKKESSGNHVKFVITKGH